MVNIEQSQAQAQQARSQLESQRQRAEQSKQQLEKARKALPSRTSQMALRQKFAGLNGRGQRRKIREAELEIGKRQEGVREFKAELTKFEVEKLKPVEESIKEQQAFERAKKIFSDVGSQALFFGGTGDERVDRLLRQFEKQKRLSSQERFELENIQKEISEGMDVSPKDVKRFEKAVDINLKKSELLLKNISRTADPTFKAELETKITDLKNISRNLESIKVEGIKAITVPGVIEKVRTKDLSIKDTSKIDDINGISGIYMGDDKIQRTRVGSFISSIIGTKDDFKEKEEKARQISTGSVISAAEFFDPLKGEQFREKGKIIVERFGTITEQLPKFEEKTFTQLREEALLFDKGKDQLFIQEAPKSTLREIETFIPVVGQIRPTVEAGRRLSEEQRILVGGEALIGAGGVSQKEVRKAIGGFGFQAGLLGFDIAFVGGATKAGAKFIGAEARALRKIKKATPEIFFGVEESKGEVSKLLIASRREAGKVRAETLTKFDVLKTGEKTAQIQKGKGVQEIIKDGEVIKKTEFTLFGEAQQVPAREVRKSGELIITKEIRQPTSAFFTDIKVLTSGESPQLLKSFGLGLQRDTGKVTQVLSFPIEKGIKTSRFRLFGEPVFGKTIARTRIKDLDAIGIIKPFKREAIERGIKIKAFPDVIESEKVLKLKKTVKQIGESTGLQVETKVLESQIPVVKKVSRPFAPPVKEEIITKTIIKQETIQAPTKNQFIEIESQKAIPSFKASVDFKKSVIFIPKQISSQILKKAEISKLKEVQKTKIIQAQQKVKIQVQDQIQRQKTSTQSIFKTTQQQKVKQKVATAIEKAPVTKTTLLERLSKKVKEGDKEDFEAFGFKLGKKVSVAKGTKEEVSGSLKKFLKKGLSASGFIEETKTGKKVKAADLLTKFGSEFRVGKSDQFKIVEKKEKRLRRSGTGFEIQAFRKVKSKRSKRTGFF